MAKENNFNSIDDLYKRLLPAMNTKIKELKRININVNNIDIWEYCLKNIWNNKNDLRIYEMVSDILNVDELELINYIKNRRSLL